MQGSFSLAIIIVGTGIRHFGAGENPRISSGLLSRSTSAGATRNAPSTLRRTRSRAQLAQCANARHPRLCATITTEPGQSSTTRSSWSIHCPQSGVSQSLCSTQRQSGCSARQIACQWAGPEPCQPGTSRGIGLIPGIGLLQGLLQACRSDFHLLLEQLLDGRGELRLEFVVEHAAGRRGEAGMVCFTFPSRPTNSVAGQVLRFTACGTLSHISAGAPAIRYV